MLVLVERRRTRKQGRTAPALPISPDNAVYKAELRQLFQECQVAGSRVGHPPEVPVTDEASFRQDSTLYATW